MIQLATYLNITTDFAVLFTLFVPLIGAFLAGITRNPNARDAIVIFVGVVLLVCVINLLLMAQQGGSGGIPAVIIADIMPGLSLSLYIDPLGMLFALIASFLWIVTSIYSIGYMRGNNEPNQNRFYVFFALSIFATMGIAFAGNLFTMFLFYEFLTLCTFPLVTHHRSEEAKKAGRTYLGILLATSIGLQMVAIIWTYNIAGTLDFEPGGILTGKVTPAVAGILLLLYAYGVGKAALMPVHKWLPAAMVAPTPVSALLHAVAVVKAGVFAILKIIVYIFGTENLSNLISQNWWAGGWLPWLASFTIITASIIALKQDSLKRRLAYSTISQLSYIVLAASLLAPKAIIAAGFHIAAHAFGKITLFFAAGSIYTASGKKYISELDGIGRRMPWTMTAFAIGAVSMIGLPPAAGFISKFYLMQGAHEQSQWFIWVLIGSTVLNALYLLPIVYAAFFRKEKAGADSKTVQHGEAPLPIVIALTITALATIITFIYPDLFLWLAGLVVQ